MLGNPGHLNKIKEIARKNNLHLIEDCAQAMGATFKGKSVGRYGDIGAFSLNVYKTITAGDGGLLVTDNKELFNRAFAIHDQGHLPLRQGVEQGKRTILGLNFRMNELTAAVAAVQLKKLDFITAQLHKKKQKLKKLLLDVGDIEFRKILDEKGEVGTLLTFFMPDKESAQRLAEKIGCVTVAKSGWHVYSNMEHLLGKMTVNKVGCPFTCPHYEGPEIHYESGMLPNTDEILERAINISIGVQDPGIGSAYGITINSNEDHIRKVALNLKNKIKESIN
jgi:8-amino-3,8-dideoxy-alpha-D-manno-octulosonate transaminase